MNNENKKGTKTGKLKGLSRRAKFIVTSAVLAVCLAVSGIVSAVLLSNKNIKIGGTLAEIGESTSDNGAISTAITASSGLGRYNNGDSYRYTNISGNNPVANQTRTVTRGTWGTAADPYVIRNASDWLFMVNAVNNGTAAPSGGTAYASATYVINAGGVLDFNNTDITPVGTQSHPFTGIIYGNNTGIYFANLSYVTATNISLPLSTAVLAATVRVSGLVGITSGNAMIADITIDNSCKMASSMLSYSWTASGYPAVGSFVGMVNAGTRLVNCTSKMSISLTNTVANNSYCGIGGLVGYLGDGGTGLTVIGCSYVGTMTIRGSSRGSTNDASKLGGMVGVLKHSATYVHSVVVSASYFNTTMNVTNCGLNGSGLIGGVGCPGGSVAPGGGNAGVKFNVQNSFIEWNCHTTDCGSPDYSGIAGYPYTVVAGSVVSNVGIISNAENMAGCGNSLPSSVVTSTNVYSHCSYGSADSTHTEAAVRTNIAGNSNIKNYLNVDNAGNVSGVKNAVTPLYMIHYNVGGLAGANAPASSYYSSGQNKTLNNPVSTPTGTIFNNWRYGNVNGTSISSTNGRSEHLTVYATYKLNNSSVTHKNVSETYGVTNQVISHTFEHAQITAGNATVANVKWFKPDGTQITSGQDGITIGQSGNTFSLTFAKPTVAQSGTYKMTYTLKPTATGAANGLVETETRTQNATLTIAKKQIYKPVFDQAATYTYNGAEQTVKYEDTKNSAADKAFYTINEASTKKTNAGTYYASVTLNDPANFEWVVAPQDPDTGANLAKNAEFRFKWIINKVNFGIFEAATEANAIIRYYPKNDFGYVGQQIGVIGFENTSYAKYKNAAGEMVNVEGTFEWKAPTTRLTNGRTTDLDGSTSWAFTAVAKFTPKDTTNFEVHEREKNVTINQLNATFRVVKPDGAVQIYTKAVDYGEDITFTKTDLDNNPNAYEGGEKLVFTYKINGVSATLELPETLNSQGYSLGVYKNSTSGGLTNEIESGDEFITAVQENKTLYIGYTAQYVGYTIFHVREYPAGGYAEEDEIKNAGEGDYATLLVERQEITAAQQDKKTGEVFSPLGKLKTYEGFAFDNDETASTVTIGGDGKTQVFIYYARQQYRLSFKAQGASPSSQTVNYRYDDVIKAPTRVPTKANTTFAGWYSEESLKTLVISKDGVNVNNTKMPGRDMTLYAKFEAKNYKVTFDFNRIDDGTNTGNGINTTYVVGGDYTWNTQALFPHENEGDAFYDKLSNNDLSMSETLDVTYNIDNMTANINLLQILPVAEGYTFVGWYNASGTQERTLRRPSSTTADEIVLKAHWAPAQYTFSFNTLGGSSVSARRMANFTDWNIGDDGVYGIGEEPTRTGYEFRGWTLSQSAAETEGGDTLDMIGGTMFSVVDFVSYYAANDINYNLGNIVLYAKWESKPSTLVVDRNIDPKYGVADNLSFYKKTGETEDGEAIWQKLGALEKVKVKDLIRVEYKHPDNYYTLSGVTVNGMNLSQGIYTFEVGEYASSEIVIGAKFKATQFTITYNVNGGVSHEAQVNRTFTADNLSNGVRLPSNISKDGYTFNGWLYTSDLTKEAYYMDGDDYMLKDASRGGYVRDVRLVARWRANPATVRLYSASYLESQYNKPTVDGVLQGYYVYNNSRPGAVAAVTDAEIEIINPSRSSLKFIGWATTKGGSVVYPAVDGEDTVRYTVAADGESRNNLYAVWQLEDVAYLATSATNNGGVYGGSGVTVTATPSYTYVKPDGATITLTYNWYKLPEDVSEIFTEQVVPGVWVDKDGNFVDEGTEGAEPYKVRVLKDGYKAALENKGSTPFGNTNLEVGVAGSLSVSQSFAKVNQSGKYICVLEVSASGDGVDSNMPQKAFGEFEVIIQKAEYNEIVYANGGGAYTQSAQGLGIDLINGATGAINAERTSITLSDGSILTVTYKYYIEDTSVEGGLREVTPIAAGSYIAEASFAFEKDNGNYKLPNAVRAMLTITPRELTQINFHMYNGETEVTGENAFNVTYNGNVYEVRATIDDTKDMNGTKYVGEGGDDVIVNLNVYKTGSAGAEQLTGDNAKTKNAGNYYVMITNLTGEHAGNYTIGAGVARQRTYVIGKADRELDESVVFGLLDGAEATFTDGKIEVEFDNAQHLIELNGKDTLPAGVTVEYSKEYTSAEPGFTSDNYVADKVEFMKAPNGGLYAGEYVVTATFKDTESANYNEIAAKTATLVIKKTSYLEYFKKTDEAGHEKNELELGGFIGAAKPYSTQKTELPYVHGDVRLANTSDFALTYEYYWSQSYEAYVDGNKTFLASGTYDELKELDTDENPLIRDSGYYTIVVNVEYLNPLYANNFEAISESERTIHISIANGTVEKIEVTFKDEWGVDVPRYIGNEFRLERIASIDVYYVGNETPVKITNYDRIALVEVDYGTKLNDAGVEVDQTAFWHVGKLPITFTMYEKSVTYNFQVKEVITNVSLKYESAERTYEDIPEMGLDLANEPYTFVVRYMATDESGKQVMRDTTVNAPEGGLTRGVNKLTIAEEANYEFDVAEVSVVAYKVITDAEVTWQYRLSGTNEWQPLSEGIESLPYAGVAYEVRVRFENEEGNPVVFPAHTYSGLDVLNYKSDDYHLEVGMVEQDGDGNNVYYYIDVHRDLGISKVVLEFDWTGEELAYNRREQSPVATVKNAPNGEEIKLSYSYTNENGGAAMQVVYVGSYTAWVYIDESVYTNYTLLGSTTSSKPFEIVKADINADITYQEHDYPVNTTYQNNPQGLRTSALKADFKGEQEVQGTFRFIKNYDAETGAYEEYESESAIASELVQTGFKQIRYMYTPTDVSNYNVKIGTINMEIKAQNAKSTLSVQLGVGAIRFYLVNQTFSAIGIEVYRLYDSYYQENGKTYGYSVKLNSNEYNMMIGNMSAENYRITSNDLGTGYITVRVTSVQGRTGTVQIQVTDKQPDNLTIGNDNLKEVWYVGEKFEFPNMTFTAWYTDSQPTEGLTQGTVTSDYDNHTFEINDVGTVTITFEFFGVYVTKQIEVRAKEDLVLLTDVDKPITLAWRNDVEIAAPQLRFELDGKTVTSIEGVEYTVTVTHKDDPNVQTLSKIGTYTLLYKFNITNPRFNYLASVMLTVEVTEIQYLYDYEEPEELESAYTGQAQTLPEATITNIRDAVTDEPVNMSDVNIVYKVNGVEYESGTIINVGNYLVEVTVYVKGEEVQTHEYSFSVETADNEVSVSINNIREGGELRPQATAKFGQDRVIYEYNTTNGTAGWGVRVPTAAGVYYVRARITADGDNNYRACVSEAVRFEIRQGEIAVEPDENGDSSVIIDGGENGIASGVTVTVEKVSEEVLGGISVKHQNVMQGYDVTLKDGNGNTVQPEGKLTVRLLISEELRERNDLRVYYIGEDGKATDMEATREGNYMVFETDHLSRYVISYKVNTVPVALLVCVIIGAVLAAGVVVACVVVGIKKRGDE